MITVPDEEVNSRGMIEAVPALKEMEKKHDITLTACLNAEPMFENFPAISSNIFIQEALARCLRVFSARGLKPTSESRFQV